MKEFEKWSKKEYYTYDALCRTDAMKLTWRAALEWVMEEFSLSPIGNRAIREELQDDVVPLEERQSE